MEYLLKSMLCLVLLLLFHRLFLQQEAIHRFNRFYLLAAVVFSFFIPFNSIEIDVIEPVSDFIESSEKSISYGDQPVGENFPITAEPIIINSVSSRQFPMESIIWGGYFLIAGIFLIRFVKNIKVLKDQIHQNLKITYKGITLVLLEENSLPFSFLKYIFVSKSIFESGEFSDEIFQHELTHVKEGHSWDVLFIELLLIPFWFHPGLYMAKQAIRLNHEFIADQAALRSTSLRAYQRLLLSMAVVNPQNSLVSSLNFSLTKKRLEMMKKKSNPIFKWVKLMVMIPVLGVMVYVFSEKVAAYQEDDSLEKVEGFIPNNFETTFTLRGNGSFIYQGDQYEKSQLPEILEKLAGRDLLVNIIARPDVKMAVIHDFQQELREKDIRRIKYLPSENQGSPINKAEYYKNVTFTIVDKNGQKAEKSYVELPDNLKADLMSPPTKPSYKIPDNQKFEEWKNSEKFALWIDGKVIPNEELAGRKSEEFVYFFESFVHNNARSVKFPQPYQVSLYTANGFEDSFGKGSGFGMPYTGEMTIYLEESEKWPPTEEKEEEKSLVLNYNELNTRYEKLRNTKPHFVERSEEEQKNIEGLFSELGSIYFRIPLDLKGTVKRPTHPFAPYLKLRVDGKVYYKLTEDLTAEEKSQLPPPPVSKDRVAAYNQIFFKYEWIRMEGRKYSNKSQEERAYMYELYNAMQEQFLAMNPVQRRQVKRVNYPFIPMNENGQLTFKVLDELTPEQRAFAGC